MITNKKMAEVIMAKLNASLGDTAEGKFTYNGKTYSFYVHSNEGEYKKAVGVTQRSDGINLINGILIEQSTTPVALQNLKSYMITQSLQFIVPIDLNAEEEYDMSGDDDTVRTNGIGYVMGKFSNFVSYCAGLTDSMTDGATSYYYILSVSSPDVQAEDYKGSVGKSIVVTFSITWQLIADGVLSNKATWKLKHYGDAAYQDIVVIDGSIVRTRTGSTSNYENDEEMKTVIEQQGLTIKLIMPYKYNDGSNMLVGDELSGTVPQKYTIQYDDRIPNSSGTGYLTGGHTFTYDVVAKEITQTFSAGKGMTISATFELAK